MALTTERVKLFFEWFLFFAAIFIAITILYILLVLLFEVPKYIKQLVRYLVEYLTKKTCMDAENAVIGGNWRPKIPQSCLGKQTGSLFSFKQTAVIPQASQVNPSQQIRRDDQGRRGNVGPMF
nr:movement protein [Banana bunchy top virus]